ncbi:hypothetical protein IU471_28080 [Nocardia elegans]|nr:hypothetical protein [Nocardia farcinica]MBF6247398.1 hypothetical protein [Nocardia elegans]PEH78287.1 hypothetical protein CRM89_21845 [Nocardia sp. FDAARGOS_372]MBF6188220.1 hypothetical protein [Nocardia farcinica]MBF6270839.1 hypothetical protein [Nocardia farcinica]
MRVRHPRWLPSELMSEEQVPATTAEVVAGWAVPAGARKAGVIKAALLQALEDEDFQAPELVADLVVGPLLIAVGELEVALGDAQRRIAVLERALADRLPPEQR